MKRIPYCALSLFLFYNMNTSIFAYNGNNITFKSDNGIMILASEMAKPFGKKPVEWLRTQSSTEFIETLSEVRKCTSTDLVQVTHGDNGGTWMHEDVAIEFARWLSPSFAIWCNDKIKELMQNGVATISDDDEMIARAMVILQNRLDAKQKELTQAKEIIAEQAPKVEFFDAVADSKTAVAMNEVAKVLAIKGYGRNNLFEFLRQQKVLMRNNRPYATYIDRGYFRVIEQRFQQKGEECISFKTLVYQRGIEFIRKLIQNKTCN